MDHGAYIIPAYIIAVGGVGLMLAQSWWAMRKAEGRAERLRRERRGRS